MVDSSHCSWTTVRQSILAEKVEEGTVTCPPGSQEAERQRKGKESRFTLRSHTPSEVPAPNSLFGSKATDRLIDPPTTSFPS